MRPTVRSGTRAFWRAAAIDPEVWGYSGAGLPEQDGAGAGGDLADLL